MNFDSLGFTKLGDEIYVYNNFVSKEECERIVSLADSFTDKAWHEIGEGRTSSVSLTEIEKINARLSSMIGPELNLGRNCSIVRTPTGVGWGEHSDDHDFQHISEAASKYVEGEPFDVVENSLYGVVIYFNDFEGGEIYYTTQGIEYKPKPGDLLIHSSKKHCAHGVRPVKSKFRYSHSNHISNFVKVPK